MALRERDGVDEGAVLGLVEGRALGAALGIPLGSDDTEGAAEMVGDEDGSGLSAKRKNIQRQTRMLAIISTSVPYIKVAIIRQYMYVLLHQLQNKTHLMVGAALVEGMELGRRLGLTDGISVGILEGPSLDWLGMFEGNALGRWEGATDWL